MAAASVNTPIKDTVGATFSAGFDITAKTAIDGRMTVQTTSDLTDSRAWQSKSGTAAAPEYWLYNGLFTSVADTGKLYVLAGIDETLPKTIWPNPAAPGAASSGPRWVEAGGTDSFLKEAYIVDAKYGYVTGQEHPSYYESDDPLYDQVYEDQACTIPAEEKKYLKLVVTQGGGSSVVTNVIYCDVQNLIKNIGRTLSIYGQGTLAASFDGTADKSLNLTGSENIEVTAIQGTGINFGLVWQEVVATLGRVTLTHSLEGFGISNMSTARRVWGTDSIYDTDKLAFTKSWDFGDSYTYVFDTVYNAQGIPSVLGELDSSLVTRPYGKKFVGWKCTCDADDHDEVTIYEDGVINTATIEHELDAGEEYNINLILKYVSTLVNVTIDSSQCQLDGELTWQEEQQLGHLHYSNLYTEPQYVRPIVNNPSAFAIDLTRVIGSNPTSPLYSTCKEMWRVWTHDTPQHMTWTAIDPTLTLGAQLSVLFGGPVYSQGTYDPNQGETASTYDISNNLPSTIDQDVYGYCDPIATVPTVYWYGNTNAGGRDPNDTSFVNANPSTGTSTSYKIRPITMSSGPLNISIPEYNSGYGRGYQLNNNNSLTFELNGQDNVVIIVQSSGSSARNLTLTLPDGSTQTIVAVPSGNTDPTNVVITKPAMTGTCTISNAAGGAVVVGYIGAYKA